MAPWESRHVDSPPEVCPLLSQLAEERIGSIRTVRAFGKETAEIERYTSRVQGVMQLARRAALAQAGFFGAVSTPSGKGEEVRRSRGESCHPAALAINRKLLCAPSE